MATTPDGVLVYKSRYGATQQYAEWIKKELRIPMIDPERVDDQVLSACDFLVIGTPVYRGEMLIKKWLEENERRLRSKRLCVFIVCTHFADREKQQMMIRENIPAGLLASCQLHFLPGRLTIEKLTPEDAGHLGLEPAPAARQTKHDQPEYSIPIHEESILPLVQSVRSYHTAFHDQANRV